MEVDEIRGLGANEDFIIIFSYIKVRTATVDKKMDKRKRRRRRTQGRERTRDKEER